MHKHQRRPALPVSAGQRIWGEDEGLCAERGGAIAFDRLHLEPWTLRCMTYESTLELRPCW
jgi:RNA polymerase-binding transcription factor DksA